MICAPVVPLRDVVRVGSTAARVAVARRGRRGRGARPAAGGRGGGGGGGTEGLRRGGAGGGAGAARWRVDELTPIGERDLYRDGAETWSWDSGERRALATREEAPVRFARPADLLPPELGRRVAAAADEGEVRRI